MSAYVTGSATTRGTHDHLSRSMRRKEAGDRGPGTRAVYVRVVHPHEGVGRRDRLAVVHPLRASRPSTASRSLISDPGNVVCAKVARDLQAGPRRLAFPLAPNSSENQRAAASPPSREQRIASEAGHDQNSRAQRSLRLAHLMAVTSVRPVVPSDPVIAGCPRDSATMRTR
jgi:hypothetical protein